VFQQDYILRQVQAIVEGIARALNLVAEQRHDDADAALEDTLDQLLRVDRELFDSLDASSVLPLLGEPERVAAIARVLAAQAELRTAQGRADEAGRLRRRALVLLAHAQEHDVDCDATLQSLRAALAGEAAPPAIGS
jgi:hypothetical protein